MAKQQQPSAPIRRVALAPLTSQGLKTAAEGAPASRDGQRRPSRAPARVRSCPAGRSHRRPSRRSAPRCSNVFVIEDLRRNGPRPADVEWRAARAEQAPHEAHKDTRAAATQEGARSHGKLREWLTARKRRAGRSGTSARPITRALRWSTCSQSAHAPLSLVAGWICTPATPRRGRAFKACAGRNLARNFGGLGAL